MAEDTSAQDYVRVKRRNTIIFLYVQLSDTASDLRQKLSAISKVDAAEMKLFLDKNGDVPLDEKKSLADQKARPLPGRASTQCRTLAVPATRLRCRPRRRASAGGAGRKRPGDLPRLQNGRRQTCPPDAAARKPPGPPTPTRRLCLQMAAAGSPSRWGRRRRAREDAWAGAASTHGASHSAGAPDGTREGDRAGRRGWSSHRHRADTCHCHHPTSLAFLAYVWRHVRVCTPQFEGKSDISLLRTCLHRHASHAPRRPQPAPRAAVLPPARGEPGRSLPHWV